MFGRIPIGNYVTTLNQAGWVDKRRAQLSTQNVTVNNGTTVGIQMSYALAAALTVTFETKIGTAALTASTSEALTVANPAVPAVGADPAGSVTFPSAAPPALPAPVATISALSLFPFPDGYSAYAGNCPASDPTKYNPTGYYATYGGFTNVTPGVTTPLKVRVPAFNVQALYKPLAAAATPFVGAKVVVKNTTRPRLHRRGEHVRLHDGRKRRAAIAGLPYGNYSACIDDSSVQPVAALRRRTVVPIPPPALHRQHHSGWPAVHRRPARRRSSSELRDGAA